MFEAFIKKAHAGIDFGMLQFTKAIYIRECMKIFRGRVVI